YGEDVPIERLTIHRSRRLPGVHKVKIGPSKTKVFLDIGLYFRSKKLLKNSTYDLLHTHEEASFWGVNFARRFKIPHLYDMHSSLPQQLDNFKFTRSHLIKSVFRYLEKRTITSANAVITICPELQRHVESNYPQTTSVLIENVADNSLVFPTNDKDRDLLQRRFGLEGKRVVLYYGTFETYQGIDLLINSAEILLQEKLDADLHFLLVGGSEEQVRCYRSVVQRKGLESAFTFTGFVPPQLIPGLIDIAEILVSPRLEGNNSPLKIYSYLRSGRPIVATRHITHTQVLSSRIAILTDIHPGAFARGISELLIAPERGRELARQAGLLADEKYSYTDYLKKVEWIVSQATGMDL
ncbi:glycosyltransferase, partial [candidate division KSB1 bacterium]|nr:glycosyltransferase [candidate division KSB1 bacterium]